MNAGDRKPCDGTADNRVVVDQQRHDGWLVPQHRGDLCGGSFHGVEHEPKTTPGTLG